MKESILESIKEAMGIVDPSDTSFDNDLIMAINTVLMSVMQEWHGMDHAFHIEDATARWSDLLGSDDKADYEAVKTLILLKVRMLFDPPTSSVLVDAINEQIKDIEWRLYFWKDLERIEEGK